MAFPLRIKKEPGCEENTFISGSTLLQKSEKRPKPTWSLKELSDDEEAARDNHEESSEYEPSSSTDSDSDDGNKVVAPKRLKLSSPSDDDNFQTNRNYKGSFKRFSSENDGTRKVPRYEALLDRLQPENGTCGHDSANDTSFLNCDYIIQLVQQLQEINRTTCLDVENYEKCTKVFKIIFLHLKNNSSLDSLKVITTQLHLLFDIILRRKSQGNSVANQVHYSLVSKKLIDLLNSLKTSGIGNIGCNYFHCIKSASGNLKPRDISNPSSSQVKFVNESPSRKQQHKVKSKRRRFSNEFSKSDCSIITCESCSEEDDLFPVPTIKSVATLQDRKLEEIPLTFDSLIATVLKGRIPTPVSQDREREISWMGYDHDGGSFSQSKSDHASASDKYLATSPCYTLCKFPPNVPIVCTSACEPELVTCGGTLFSNNSEPFQLKSSPVHSSSRLSSIPSITASNVRSIIHASTSQLAEKEIITISDSEEEGTASKFVQDNELLPTVAGITLDGVAAEKEEVVLGL